MTEAQTAEFARLALLSAIEVAAIKAGVSVETMCNAIQANPTGNAAMFVRKLVGIA
jgi:hypothetical protein